MNDTTQLPPSEREAFEAFAQNCPMGKYSITRRGDGYDSSHTQLMWDAWQARAQVQGVPFGYIHHFVAHDDSGVIIDTTWEADGCADAMPHPTHPAAWKWSHATPFYTTPQPAQATQAEVTDEQINAAYLAWCKTNGTPESFARAILALRPVQSGLTGCNCRWDGDTQVQWCELHLAHKEAIHEWAERAKEAEKQLALRPAIQQAESEPCKSFTELRDRHREGVDAELAAMAAEAKTDEPVAWGWAIVDNKGLERITRARIQDFFGSNQEAKPFSLEDVAREDREFAGCAPHHVITLFTHPAPGVPDWYVPVPLQVLRDAADALGNFINDLGWDDSDMQAMDNLDAYIAQHTATQAQKGQP